MKPDYSIWDDAFHAAAWQAFIDEARKVQGWPDSRTVKARAYRLYEAELSARNQRYVIETEILGDWENTWTHPEDGAPITFATLQEAQDKLREYLRGQHQAVDEGDMEEKYDPDEFRIRCGDTFYYHDDNFEWRHQAS